MPSASAHYSLLGLVFSEKSWTYLLATQLLLSEGLASIIPGLVGIAAGYLYDVDWFGSQRFRIPQPLERFFSMIGVFFSSVGPAGPQRPPSLRRPVAGSDNGIRSNDLSAAPAGGSRGLDGPISSRGMRFRPQQQQQAALIQPDEESVRLLISMGFDREAVLRALQATGNNVETAANLLISQ